jgi:DNA-binding response OmpR family regulator
MEGRSFRGESGLRIPGQRNDRGVLPASLYSELTLSAPIIISDNDPQISRLFEHILRRRSLTTLVVSDPSEVTRLSLNRAISLVISDLMKPRINGLDILQALRGHWLTAHIPFMMVTATATVEHRERFRKLGGDCLMFKPIDVQQFGDAVLSLLERVAVRLTA